MFEPYGEIIFLLVFILVPIVTANSDRSMSCECNADHETVTLRCRRTNPDTLPLNTRVLNITGLEYEHLTQPHFNHARWASVTKLYLRGGSVNSVFDNTFWNVRNLTHLQISFPDVYYISFDAFSRLTKLRSLDLSRNYYISFYEGANSLNVTEFTNNLDELNLQLLVSSWTQRQLNETFCIPLKRSSIKRMELSHSNVRNIDPTALSLLKTSLEELHMVNVDLSFVFYSDMFCGKFDCIQQESSDTSFSPMKSVESFESISNAVSYYNCLFPLFQANNLRMNNIMLETIITKENVTYKSLNCNRDVKGRFELKNNRIRVLDIKFDPNMPMYREVDLSNNGLEYLSLNATSHFTILNWISLTQNNLGAMENYTEFVDLFAHNLDLTSIDLSFNNLKRLPIDFFVNNRKLNTIIISNNLLSSQLFRIEHLNKLEYFDISNNNILFLDSNLLRTFESMKFEMVSNHSHLRQFSINLAGNIFKCECDTKSFIQWILTTQVTLVHRESYICEMKKNVIKINDNSPKDIEQICDRSKIILMTSLITLFSAGILVIIGIILIGSYRRCLNLRHIKFLIEKYRKEDPPNKHLVFLSFCSSDRDFVYRYIIDELKDTLSARLDASKDDIVCIGDIHFEPGRYILDEIIRCTQNSCVVLLVVSEAFCKSHYCDFEALCAELEKKPIILMFLEDVDPKCMSKIMYKHFQRYTRVKWTRNGDEFELVPSWAKVCDSICTLAGANARFANKDSIVEQTPLTTI
ncbi:hypothetical protein ACJMK2_020851 [Sinanodonta woodiana]|uniref:TIR domain-containing protein n=1 Tax=Sinanodonta woodiana TaxID=1069815 RepID=A0ABD3U1S9_SINWO